MPGAQGAGDQGVVSRSSGGGGQEFRCLQKGGEGGREVTEEFEDVGLPQLAVLLHLAGGEETAGVEAGRRGGEVGREGASLTHPASQTLSGSVSSSSPTVLLSSVSRVFAP